MSQLKNKIAVVIGGVGGIGGAVSTRFADEGARVYATSRNKADAPADRAGEGSLHMLQVDASDLSELNRLFETLRADEGRIDTLVINAGMAGVATLGSIEPDHFDRIFGLNVRSLLFAAQGAIDLMSAGGTIVLIGSIADEIGTKGYGVYNASKAAVRSFARTWANELAPRGIRVNVVSPGPTDTAMMSAASPEMRDTLTQMIPLGRFARPDEVAAAALFLASSESSFTTGAELCVDGGLTQV
jgi:NAD(P)-dependent dehydrogenase (short-subunit alcohol dehydrogenase family)